MARLVITNEMSDRQFRKLYKNSRGFNPKLNPNKASYDLGESAGSYLIAGAISLVEKNPSITRKLV